MQNACVFFSIVNIYMLLHIYILYSSWLYPGLPCTLCHLTGFHFPLFSLVKWSQVMLLLLRTEHSLDEIQHGYAEKAWNFCSRSIGKALEQWTRKPCKCPACVLLATYTKAVGSLAERPATYCSDMAEGENHVVSLHQKTPKTPNLEMQWDIL